MKLLYISRHIPTAEQKKLTEQMGYSELVNVGDLEAHGDELEYNLKELIKQYDHEQTIACVHPNIAMTAIMLGLNVVIWQSDSRPTSEFHWEFKCIGATRWNNYVPLVKEHFKLE